MKISDKFHLEDIYKLKNTVLTGKTEDIKLPQLDKKAIQQKVRSTLYKYPIIPFLFYGAAILILIGGLFYVFKSFI